MYPGIPYHPWDWYIYLHLVDFMVNVGKYTIHGSYGNDIARELVLIHDMSTWIMIPSIVSAQESV